MSYSYGGNLDVHEKLILSLKDVYVGTSRSYQKPDHATCEKCEGTGKDRLGNRCKACRGLGSEPVTLYYDVDIPAGADTGYSAKIEGWGNSNMFNRGDFYVDVQVRPDSVFTRKKDDLYVNVEVDKELARQGGEISVPLPDETFLTLVIPAGTVNKRTFRVFHKGMPIAGTQGHGHLYVRVLLVGGIARYYEGASPAAKKDGSRAFAAVTTHLHGIMGNYRLVRLLGEGGFASVYLGEHIHLKTPAAIKILQGKMTTQDLERFKQEARSLADLRHPHIVRLLDFGIEGTTPYLIMEYAPRGTVLSLYPSGTRMLLPQATIYMQQIATALQYAHGQQIVHCDIKPANMLVSKDGTLLLTDFGIAIRTHQTHALSTKEAIGTVSYMAPEQIRGKPCKASDQYALAVVLYEWLSGSCPFDGDTAIEIAVQHLTQSPPSLCTQVPGFPQEVEHVLFTALAKGPEARFQDVQAFSTAFEQATQLALP